MNTKDAPYIWPDTYGKALGSYWCRHDYKHHEEINKLFNDNLDLFQLAWECTHPVLGKVLFTHAGVTNTMKEIIGLDADSINNFYLKESTKDIPNVVGLAEVSFYRGGYSMSGSPVWADVREHLRSPILDVFQIFGHTYSKNILRVPQFAMLDIGRACFMLNDEEIIEV